MGFPVVPSTGRKVANGARKYLISFCCSQWFQLIEKYGLFMTAHQTAIKRRCCRKTCSHTSGKGWWKVDLGDNYSVEKIWIRNRIDCCSERLDGVEVNSCHLLLTLDYTNSFCLGNSLRYLSSLAMSYYRTLQFPSLMPLMSNGIFSKNVL